MMGHELAGMTKRRIRVEDDFYATPTSSTEALLEKEQLIGPILEPACGQGHISKLIEERGGTIASTDLIDRGYGTGGIDFLTYEFKRPYATIITNPPFSLFQEFAERALTIADKKVILFGKIQALEGVKRAAFMERSPLRTVYVFKARQNPLRNGAELDENGKAWTGTMAFAWYVWEKGYEGKPMIEWL